MSIKKIGILSLVYGMLLTGMTTVAQAELVGLEEGELSEVSGRSGISIELPRLRVNAQGPGSLESPNENDGRGKGFKFEYVTREHNGDNKTHLLIEEVSLAVDTKGAFTVDIEGDGKLVIGLPDSVNYVGDGFRAKDIYLNGDGMAGSGGKLLNEISIQGNFNTGGTVSIWGK